MSFKKIFNDVKQFQVFFLGAFSGMPLTILYTTMAAWLTDANIDLKVITTFAISRAFYSFKFLWAPFLDHMNVPLISKIGHRKSWTIIFAIGIGSILYSLSFLDPNQSIFAIYWLAIALGVLSASFDIVFDAFRIEKIETNMQSLGAANTVLGYRLGVLIAGAGAFVLADKYGWSLTFTIIASLYLVCILFILLISEPKIEREIVTGLDIKSWRIMVIDPFYNFFRREYSIIILLAVIFYKLGDAMLGVVATPFYLELGFSKTEIAYVVKIFGLGATILGTYIGGLLMFSKGDIKGLFIAGILQSVTNASFIWLNHMGHDINALILAITIENVAAGMGSAALVGYLSNLCNRQYSATQYALLSSASGLASHSIVVYGGFLQNMIGWDWYFSMTIILAIPGLVLLYILNQKIIAKA